MNDKELLGMAAKAAEINFHHVDDIGVWWCKGHMSTGVACWNPLKDDGDALRLAVGLGIEIVPSKTIGETQTAFMVGAFGYNLEEEWGEYRDGHGDDPMKATRRVIVRSAAQIGKAMP